MHSFCQYSIAPSALCEMKRYPMFQPEYAARSGTSSTSSSVGVNDAFGGSEIAASRTDECRLSEVTSMSG